MLILLKKYTSDLQFVSKLSQGVTFFMLIFT